MPSAAEAMGDDLDYIDSGGQGKVTRPEPDQRENGAVNQRTSGDA